jgi:N-acetylneuraminate lyase
VNAVFVAGSTGESHSLAVEERLALAQRWSEVLRSTNQRLIVHVGSNCLADACTLAAHARSIGADAIAALAPSYFKPKSLDALTACCAEIAAAAPGVPFYYYDIPAMTGVHHSMPDFLATAGERIPTLAGLKFTNPDLMAYQRCLAVDQRRFNVLWGLDEMLLAALALGAPGAVGSTYNFAAPIYQRIIAAHERGDLAAARVEQLRSVELIELLASFGFMAAAKAVMGFLGVDVGPVRLPNVSLKPEESRRLRTSLEGLGFFDWIAA